MLEEKIKRWEQLCSERLKTIKDRDEINALESDMMDAIKGKMSCGGKDLAIWSADKVAIEEDGEFAYLEFDDAVDFYWRLTACLKLNGLI